MLTVEEIEAIRRAYFREHKGVRAIAREQQHGRRAVRAAIAGTDPAPRRYRLTKQKRRRVLDPVAPIIDRWLTEDAQAPRKQRHTSKRVYDRLVGEHDFAGSERRIREYVHEWKRTHRTNGHDVTGFVPLAYAPGAEAQCDWGEAEVRIGGVVQTAALFCIRLCYSLRPFVCAFPMAKQEAFFAGHVAAFTWFRGIPRRVTYDNLTSAVKKVLQGRTRVEQEAFVAFRGHHLFDSHFCVPGLEGAHEKPLVESLVGYARRNFLVPVPDVPSWEALNALLWERCAAEDARTVARRTASIGALWHEEQSHLLPLPRHAYACCRTVPVRATRLGLVTFERNRYSVPSRYAGERLLLRAFAWQVEVSDGRTMVARHPRLYGRDGERLDPLHYFQVLERKPGAFALARPIQQWATDWPPIYHHYLEALRRQRPEGATREFVRVLQLHARYPQDVLAGALERALATTCFSADGVEQLVRQAVGPPAALAAAPPIDLAAVPALARLTQVEVPLPDLGAFNRLLRVRVAPGVSVAAGAGAGAEEVHP
jgi:transposase